MPTKLDQLEAEKAKAEKRLIRLDQKYEETAKQFDETRNQLSRIEDRIRAEQLRQAVGKPVKIRYRLPASDRDAVWMNDAVGTLVKVNRTRCVVDYGEHGEWTMPIRDMMPADSGEEQGMTFLALAAG